MTPNEVVQRLDSGDFTEDLAAALVAVSGDVVATGKKGAVSVNFEVLKAGDVAVTIVGSITRKPPKVPGRGTMAFIVDGELHKTDPRQEEMTFRVVDKATGEIRDTSDEPATIRELIP